MKISLGHFKYPILSLIIISISAVIYFNFLSIKSGGSTKSGGSSKSGGSYPPLVEPRTVAEVSGFYFYTNRSASEMEDLCEEKGLRLTDIEVRSSSPLRFDFVLGPLDGLSSSRCWFRYGYSKSNLQSYLTTHNGRILDLEVYGSSKNKLAAIVVPKEMGSSKYQFYYGVKPGDLNSTIDSINVFNSARVIDIEHYTKGSKRRYAFVTVPNSGSLKRNWKHFGNRKKSDIMDFYEEYGYQIIDLEPQKNGNYSAVLVSGFGAPNWSFRTNLKYDQIKLSYKSRDMRIVDLERYTNSSGKKRYSLVMVNNIEDRFHEHHDEVVGKLENFLDDSGATGVTVSIVKDGEIIYSGGAGNSNKTFNYKMSPYNTVQRWASISKTTPGVVAAKLHREGVLSLTRAIDYYWSSYDNPGYHRVVRDGGYFDDTGGEVYPRSGETVGSPKTPTLRMLLSHTAGIQHYSNGPHSMKPSYGDRNDEDVNTGMEWAVKKWMNKSFTAPQGKYSYSTFGPNLACVVIEKAWKKRYGYEKSFEDIFMQKIGTPFGMSSMVADRYWVDNEMQSQSFNLSGNPVSSRDGKSDVSYKLCGGGWSSTARDMAKYAKWVMTSSSTFTNADRNKIWQRIATVEPDGSSASYGLGWKSPDGGAPWHNGKQPGAKTLLKLYLNNTSTKSDDAAIVIMYNTEGTDSDYLYDLRDELKDLFNLD